MAGQVSDQPERMRSTQNVCQNAARCFAADWAICNVRYGMLGHGFAGTALLLPCQGTVRPFTFLQRYSGIGSFAGTTSLAALALLQEGLATVCRSRQGPGPYSLFHRLQCRTRRSCLGGTRCGSAETHAGIQDSLQVVKHYILLCSRVARISQRSERFWSSAARAQERGLHESAL